MSRIGFQEVMSPQKKMKRAIEEHGSNFFISGFRNVDGSSCYINAVVQGLISLEPFTREVMKIETTSNQPIMTEVQNTIRRAKEGEKKVLEPQKLVKVIRDNMAFNVGNGQQQDVHEFIMKLLEKMQEEELMKLSMSLIGM